MSHEFDSPRISAGAVTQVLRVSEHRRHVLHAESELRRMSQGNVFDRGLCDPHQSLSAETARQFESGGYSSRCLGLPALVHHTGNVPSVAA